MMAAGIAAPADIIAMAMATVALRFALFAASTAAHAASLALRAISVCSACAAFARCNALSSRYS